MSAESASSDAIHPPPTPLDYATPGRADTRWGKGFLAACGCFVVWGCGHWIAGYRRRGAIWLAVCMLLMAAELLAMALPRWTGALLVLLPLQIVFFVAMMIDAFFRGRATPAPMLGRPLWRYIAGVLVVLFGYALNIGVNRAFGSAAHRLGAHTAAISTQAMRPTLQPGDRIISHRADHLRRWDLVTFYPPGRSDVFTQRVVGLPGEKVELIQNQLFIDGQRVSPPAGLGPYISRFSSGRQNGCEGNPIQLGGEDYFLLGDNSPRAYDSRCFANAVPGHPLGAVPRELIEGRVTMIYWPPKRIRQLFQGGPDSK